MSNPANNGQLIGRLAADPTFFTNSDGSQKAVIAIYADRNFANAGEFRSDRLNLERFVPKGQGLGPLAHMHEGDLVSLNTHLESSTYQTRSGETRYAQNTVIDEITFLEPKSVTDARRAKKVAEEISQLEAEKVRMQNEIAQQAIAAAPAQSVAVDQAVQAQAPAQTVIASVEEPTPFG